MKGDPRMPKAGRTVMSRRAFVAGVASLTVTPAFAQPSVSWRKGYVAPGSDGDGSLENPASITRLGDLIEAVGAGGTIFILADRGAYEGLPTIEVSGGGQKGAPVRIIGAKAGGELARATIRGNRQRWQRPSSEGNARNAADFGGDTTFAFGSGASHLVFSGLSIENSGRVFDFADRREGDILVQDVKFHNVRDGFYTNEGSSLSNVTLRRFSGVGFSKKAIRVHGRSRGWLIEDCELDSGWQYGDNFAVGIEFNHRANGIVVNGGYTINCLDTQGGDQEKYWNADGIASETGNYNIRISGHRSAGHSDAGYDLKSEDTILNGCIAEDNKRNYRIWGGRGSQPVVMKNCQSRTPRSRGGSGASAHLWLFGSESVNGPAASAIFQGGSITDRKPGSAIVYADGNNVAVHLIDTDMGGVGRRDNLVEGDGENNVVIQGSAMDPNLEEILTASTIVAVEGLSNSVPLKTDGPASWRIVDYDASSLYAIVGASLNIAPANVGEKPAVTIQARGGNGVAIYKELHAEIGANPVGAGTALAVTFAGANGATIIRDKTGLSAIQFSGGAQIQDNAVVFNRGEDFITIADSDNFSFLGPFSIDTEFMLDNPHEEGGQDVLSHWGDESRQRGYVIRCEETGTLTFAWTYDGTDTNVSWINGPKLEAGRYYNVRVDRDEAGTVRLYVDGRMVGDKPESGRPILNASVPLRISGRAGGKYGANGRMRSLRINNAITVETIVSTN